MSSEYYTEPHPMNIPQQLRALRQWANWHHDKVIRNSRTGRNGSSTDISTWSTFAQALKRDPDRLVFIFDRINGLVGLDVDGCRNAETTEIDARGRALIERFPNIYWEISLSGTGLHGIGRGVLPDDAKGRHPEGIGIFSHSRYFVMTGHVLPGHETLGDFGDGLADLYREIAPAEPERPASPPPTLTLDDHDIIDRLINEQNGKARHLLAGDRTGYPDFSSARFALATKAAFYTDDMDQIERIIRTSGLFKDGDSERDRGRKARLDATNAATTYSGPRYDPTRKTPRLTVVLPSPNTPADIGNCADVRAELAAAQARVAELEATVAARERVIERERELRKTAEHRADRLSFERSQVMAILRNRDLGAGEKLTHFATVLDLGARIANGEEQTPNGFRLPAKRIADNTGQKVEAVRRHWKAFAKRGVLQKTNVRERTEGDGVDPETGEIITASGLRDVTHIHVPEDDITLLIAPVAAYEKIEPETRGGKRTPRCTNHPNASTTTTHITRCDECRTVLDKYDTHQHPAESSGDIFAPETCVSNTVLSADIFAPETSPSNFAPEPHDEPPLDEEPPDYWMPPGWEDDHRHVYGRIYREAAS